MRQLIIYYLKFLLQSKNQHGVHSPFVYNLLTKCFYDSTDYPDYVDLREYRKQLLDSTEFIKVNDLGPGSQIMRSNTRAVKSIAKNAGSSLNRTKLLYRLVRYFKPQKILELGTSLGIGTHAMALANPDAEIITIEGCENTASFSRTNFESKNIETVELVVGDFTAELQNLNVLSFDLIFIDGNHTESATLEYFETLLPACHNDTLIIFDDINWSDGMRSAWKKICARPEVKVSVDTFFWGLVFFRAEQEKEHFKIRL